MTLLVGMALRGNQEETNLFPGTWLTVISLVVGHLGLKATNSASWLQGVVERFRDRFQWVLTLLASLLVLTHLAQHPSKGNGRQIPLPG